MSRTTPAMKREAARYRMYEPPCWLCQQPIDYSLKSDDPDSLSVDHVKPRSTHPHLVDDPENMRPAHLRCNKQRGNRAPRPGLGWGNDVW
ncbi:HNH endonuclease [Pseudarthrobacter sp. NPDC058119]|uniref:HNH endonuclease n=1 Tax=Pseudarthrobacter sp. NPDC058119 TaxID=3346348 RepID=UPI0036D8AAAC